jgi:hypothetical protein
LSEPIATLSLIDTPVRASRIGRNHGLSRAGDSTSLIRDVAHDDRGRLGFFRNLAGRDDLGSRGVRADFLRSMTAANPYFSSLKLRSS